jgi:TPR repeat protein
VTAAPKSIAGVEIYHPLAADGELYALYKASRSRALGEGDRNRLLSLYRPSAARQGARLGIDVPPVLSEDNRALCSAFRRFFPAVIERSDLRSWVAGVPVAFPELRLVDARSLLDGDVMGAVISSGMLDLVERFAAAISLSVWLCELALPALSKLEEHPPERVPLAWLSLSDEGGLWDWLLAPVLERAKGKPLKPTLREELFERSLLDWLPAELSRGAARYHLSQYLGLLMLRSIGRYMRRGSVAELARIRAPRAGASSFAVDPHYLATLTLTFVVLHEFAHLALRHNEFDFKGVPWELALNERLMQAAREVAEEASENEMQLVDVMGCSTSFEFAADGFAVEVLDAPLQDPLLEAASLWCTVLESGHGTSQRDPFRGLLTTAGHPSYAARVWYLNGRLSRGARQGEMARTIAARAEAASREATRGDFEPEHEEAVFAALAEIAGEEIQAATPSVAARIARRAFERPLLALARREERRQAEKLFTAAMALGQFGDVDAAEAGVRRADELGHGPAANSLGITLETREELAAAEAAYRRADERGDRDGAFNLGRLLMRTRDLEGAEAAFRRAGARGERDAQDAVQSVHDERARREREESALRREDASGDADAAYQLGIRLLQTGASDEGEAALRRADARGHAEAARELGVLRRDRGDIDAAETLLQRAQERGNVAATNTLGTLFENLRGDRERAIAAYRRADADGSAPAAFNLARLLAGEGDIAEAEAAYRRADERGHSEAATNLGVMLQQRGDLEAAEDAYRRADERGDGLGAFNLGLLIEARGGPQNRVRAEGAFRRAAARGDPRALARLGRGM